MTTNSLRISAVKLVKKNDLKWTRDNIRFAAQTLANLNRTTYPNARKMLMKVLSKLERGLDPLCDERGGKRAGAGRPRTQKAGTK